MPPSRFSISSQQVAGRALVDARDIAALVDHGEAFLQGAVLPADGLGERSARACMASASSRLT